MIDQIFVCSYVVQFLVRLYVVLLILGQVHGVLITNNNINKEERENLDINPFEPINPFIGPQVEDIDIDLDLDQDIFDTYSPQIEDVNFYIKFVPEVEDLKSVQDENQTQIQLQKDFDFVPSIDFHSIPQDIFSAGGYPIPTTAEDNQIVLDDKRMLFWYFLRAILPFGGGRKFDDRTLVEDSTQMPFRSIGRIGTGCTGTVIGRRHVLTSAHCVYDQPSKRYAKNIEFQPALNVNFQPYPKYDWLYVFVPDEFVNNRKNKNQDYAVIILKEKLPPQIKPISFGNDCREGETHNVNIAGYPINKQPKNGMWTTACVGVKFNCSKYYFSYDCDTTKGMSGGSMISSKKDNNGNLQHTIRAIHQGYWADIDANIAVYINKQIEQKIKEYLLAFP